MLSSRLNPQGGILLEALVGLFLYATALAAVLALVATSLSLLSETRGRFLAARVAREGLEMVFSKHQNHLLCLTSGTCPIANWQDNLIGDFEVDAMEAERIGPERQFQAYSNTPLCTVVTPAEHRGKFTQCTGAGERPLPGAVRREVQIEPIGSDGEKARVMVTVSRDTRRGGRKAMVLEEVLFAAR